MVNFMVSRIGPISTLLLLLVGHFVPSRENIKSNVAATEIEKCKIGEQPFNWCCEKSLISLKWEKRREIVLIIWYVFSCIFLAENMNQITANLKCTDINLYRISSKK